MLSKDQMLALLEPHHKKSEELLREQPILKLLYATELKEGAKEIATFIQDNFKKDSEIKAIADHLKFSNNYPDPEHKHELDLSDCHLSDEAVEALAQFIQSDRTVYYITFPKKLIFKPEHLTRLAEAIKRNPVIRSTSGLFDINNKISTHTDNNRLRQDQNRLTICNALLKYLHQNMIKRIEANDPDLRIAEINYVAVSDDPTLQLELFSALSTNTHVRCLQANVTIECQLKDSLIHHALKDNHSLATIESIHQRDVSTDLFREYDFPKFHELLRLNRFEQTIRILRGEIGFQNSLCIDRLNDIQLNELSRLLPNSISFNEIEYIEGSPHSPKTKSIRRFITSILDNLVIKRLSTRVYDGSDKKKRKRNLSSNEFVLFANPTPPPSSSFFEQHDDDIIKSIEPTIKSHLAENQKIGFYVTLLFTLIELETTLLHLLPRDIIRNTVIPFALSNYVNDLAINRNDANAIVAGEQFEFDNIQNQDFNHSMLLLSEIQKDRPMYNAYINRNKVEEIGKAKKKDRADNVDSKAASKNTEAKATSESADAKSSIEGIDTDATDTKATSESADAKATGENTDTKETKNNVDLQLLDRTMLLYSRLKNDNKIYEEFRNKNKVNGKSKEKNATSDSGDRKVTGEQNGNESTAGSDILAESIELASPIGLDAPSNLDSANYVDDNAESAENVSSDGNVNTAATTSQGYVDIDETDEADDEHSAGIGLGIFARRRN